MTRLGTLVLAVRAPHGVKTLSDLEALCRGIDQIYGFNWRLAGGLARPERLITPRPSPASDPFPTSAPGLRVLRIRQGSLLLELAEDLATAASYGPEAAGAGVAVWLTRRVLKSGPQAVADFVAEVLSMRERMAIRRATVGKEKADAEAAEAAAQAEASRARVELWRQHHEEVVWLQYQRIVRAIPDLEARVLDEEGEEVQEPPLDAQFGVES